MEALTGIFHIDWKLILAQLVNFGVVFFVLYRFALKPLGKLMNERSETIAKGVADASTHAALVTEAKALYDAELIRARKESAHMIEVMKKEVAQERTTLLAAAKHEAEAILEEQKADLEREKQAMIAEAKTEISTLVVRATSKVLNKEAAVVDNALIEEAIRTL